MNALLRSSNYKNSIFIFVGGSISFEADSRPSGLLDLVQYKIQQKSNKHYQSIYKKKVYGGDQC